MEQQELLAKGAGAAHRPGSPPVDEVVEVTRWLCEVGRRTWTKRTPSFGPVAASPADAAPERWPFYWSCVAGGLAAAYLQYFYLDLLLEIALLPSVLVFAVKAIGG
jgi:hypothetical protein